MARLLIDGFESGGYDLYDDSANASVISSAGKDMDGNYCLDLTAGSAYVYKSTAAAGLSEIYLAALWRPSAPSALQPIFRFQNGLSEVTTLYRNNSTNKLQISGQTGTKTISNDTTYLIEVYYKIADSGGRIVVKVDDVIDIDFTGDTLDASAVFNRVYLGRDDATQTTKAYFDNFIWDDASYIGDTNIQAIVPTGAGNITEWTASAGANWECVDEIPKNDADYVSTTGVKKDTYVAGDLAGSIGSVNCVQVQSRSQNITFTNNLMLIVRSGGADYESSNKAVSAFKTYYHIWETNPADAAAWEEADVNAVEIGVKNNTGNNLGSYQVLAQVEWTAIAVKDVNASNNECLSQITAPLLTVIRQLSIPNIECLSQVTTPTIERGWLYPPDIPCSTQITVPSFTVKHSLSIPNIECLTQVTVPDMLVNHLGANDILCNTEVTVPSFTVKRPLTIPNIESSSEIGIPDFVRLRPLNAPDIACNTEVTAAGIYKELFPSDIECSSEVEAADLEWIKILKLNATLPMITAELSGGHGGFLNVELPMITAEMRGGAQLNVTLPMITAQLSGKVGIKADLNVTLPMITAEMAGTVEVLGQLNATLPMITARMSGTAGLAGQLNVTLPMITAALTGYTDIDGQLNVTLPMIEARLVGTVEREACPVLRYSEPELE